MVHYPEALLRPSNSGPDALLYRSDSMGSEKIPVFP